MTTNKTQKPLSEYVPQFYTFKIKSSTISHIGIYIGDNKFAHASNKGVAISNLNEPYYQRYFYKGGRLFESVKDQLEDN